MRTPIFLLALFIAGCSSQTVHLETQLVAKPSSVAVGHTVSLDVRDERPTATIGTREVRGTRHGDITAAGDIAAVVSQSLTSALTRKGFVVTASTSKGPTLRVDIRHLGFEEHSGIVAGKTESTAAINARVLLNSKVIYEKFYRGESTSGGQMFVARGSSNARHIRTALNSALQQMIDDPSLVAAITSIERPSR